LQLTTQLPVTCAIYARENGLLDQPGWKCFKHIAKNEKKFTRMVNQAKLKSFHTSPKYKYGFETPRTYEQAEGIDAKMGTHYGETPQY
jgi:predicted metal-binding protein